MKASGWFGGFFSKRFESRFCASVVKEDVVQVMQEGQTIKHEMYGLGIVTASDQERTAVDFDDHGPKLFVTSIMSAELIGEAPAKLSLRWSRRSFSDQIGRHNARHEQLCALIGEINGAAPPGGR